MKIKKNKHKGFSLVEMIIAIFVFSYISFLALRIDGALTLALIMGILEIIPYFGPIIGGAVVALVAFSQSFWLGIIAIIVVIPIVIAHFKLIVKY